MSEREETKEIEEKIIEDSTIKTKNNRKVNIDFDKIHEKNLQINKDSFEEIEEHKKENKINTSNKKKIVIGGIIGAVVLIILVVFSTIFALININNENIMNGVSISGIDVSGLSKDEAKGQIEVLFNEKLQKDISVKYEDYVTEINPSSIETKYNIDETLDEAYNIGRNSNIFINNYQIFGALVFKKNIDVECSVNEEIAATTIDNIGLNLPGAVIQTDYYIEESNLIIKKGKTGLGIDKDAFLNNIKNELNDIHTNEDFLTIPVVTIDPEEINIEKIHEEVCQEVANAYYTSDPFTLHQEVEGIDFDIETAKEILKEDKEEYVIPLNITKPEITLDDIGAEVFPDLLGTFSTKYDASNANRSTNLKLAANKINGKVLMPGEEFSYNKVVGERTIAAGYKEAKIYSSGQVIDGLGGGICQISSTLYNSVVFANLDVTVRRNHQFVTSYVQAGRDATVVYGSQDFKFKNSRKYPVKIKATVNNGVATISIYGIKEETEYDISFQVNTISTIPFSVSYIEDSSLASGKEVVKQNGTNGVITETYKVVKQNGKVISKTLISKDTYNAMTKIIARGTAANTSTQAANTEQNQQSTQQPQEQQPPIQQQPETQPTPQPQPESPDINEPENESESNTNSQSNNVDVNSIIE